jgi:SAM-dependent methyltransferase
MFQDIKIYKGFKKVSEYYYWIHKLLQKWEEILVLWARHGNSESKKAFSFFSDYMIDRRKTWIKTKLLFNEDINQKISKHYQWENNIEVLFMPKWYFTPISINIYRDCIDMLYRSENDIPSVIFIQGKEIAESYRHFFYFQWQSAKQVVALTKKWIYWDMNYIFDDFLNNSTEKVAIKNSLLNEIKPYSKVLNIWPWKESFIDEFSLKEVDLTLIEKNKEYCDSYPKRPNVKIVNDDFLDHDFKNISFDYIILSHSIYYFTDLKLLRDKLFKILTKWWKIFIIINSGSGNYSEIKEHFYSMLSKTYKSSYIRIKESLQNENIKFQEKTIWYNIYWSKDDIFNAIKIRFYDIDTHTATKNLPKLKKFVEKRIKKDQLYCENSLITIEKTKLARKIHP